MLTLNVLYKNINFNTLKHLFICLFFGSKMSILIENNLLIFTQISLEFVELPPNYVFKFVHFFIMSF
jgi:hypothetical protein